MPYFELSKYLRFRITVYPKMYGYTYVKSSFCFFVTSHCKHILSNGSSLRRAVLCIIAVSNDCGLKKPANQTQEGN